MQVEPDEVSQPPVDMELNTWSRKPTGEGTARRAHQNLTRCRSSVDRWRRRRRQHGCLVSGKACRQANPEMEKEKMSMRRRGKEREGGREGRSGRLMAICSPFHFNVGERPRAKPPLGSAGPYKAGVTLPRGLTGPSGNKLRGCPELYRKLLLTAESHTGLPYLYKAPAAQPAADTAGRPIKDPARAPAPFLRKKRINPVCEARRGDEARAIIRVS